MKKTILILILLASGAIAKAQVKKVKVDTTINSAAYDGPTRVEGEPAPKKAKPNQIYSAVEFEPKFPGGISEFNKFIKINQKLSPEAENNTAKVFVNFIVEKNGSLSDLKVLRSPSDAYSTEAVRIIKLSPKWKPGIQNGKAVRCYYTIPIVFGSDE